MKYVLLFLSLMVGEYGFAGTLTLEMLETLASSGASRTEDHPINTSNGQMRAVVFESYMMGFFDGVEGYRSLVTSEESKKDEAAEPSKIPAWMKDPSQSAPSVLAFIRRHTPPSADKSKLPAAPMIRAWFVYTHPTADIAERLGGYMALALLYGWGRDFPGSDELLRRAGENYAPQKQPVPSQK